MPEPPHTECGGFSVGKKKKKGKGATKYAHNPKYSMIYPDADHRDDGIVSTGKS